MVAARVVHYVNQFFAGIGSEAQAETPPGRKEGAAGPAVALQQALGEQGRVVATVYCGDSYAVEQPSAYDQLLELIEREQPDIVVVGPAFSAGRYGLACGELAVRVRERLGVTVVTGMHADNAAAELYRTKAWVASTAPTARGMGEAIRNMARLALKLHSGQELGSPQEEGYLPTGRRLHVFVEQNAGERAVEMLLRKLDGRPFTTEWAVPTYNRVIPAPPIRDLHHARIALITTGGIVPRGNPDRLEAAYASKWLKYSIEGTAELDPQQWQSIHGGFDTSRVNEDPDRMAPLDGLRTLEREGVFGKLEEHLYTTTGNTSSIPTMRKFAAEIIEELKASDIQGVILTSA